MWGIWIDKAKPPFTRDLTSPEWDNESANWSAIDANYLIHWIPVWLEDTVMTITEPLGYKMDLTRSDFTGTSTDTSLRRWIQSAPNPLTNYWKQRTDQKISGIKSEFGTREGFYSYFLAHEADLRGTYNQTTGLGQDTLKWQAIRYAINKIKQLDPEHKSYIVHNVRYQFGAFPFGITLEQFADLFPNLDIFQMDDYVLEHGGAVAYNYQQQRLDTLLKTYDKCMAAFKDKHTEWHAIIQSQSDKNDAGPILRRPRVEELRVQAYLALSRGARGVTAFVYGSSEELPSSPQPPYAGFSYLLEGAAAASSSRYYNGVVDNDRLPFTQSTDPEQVPAFDNLNSVFQEIAIIGPVVRKLRIYDAFPNSSIPSGNSAGIYSISGDKIEIGTFKRMDESSDSTNYFIVVNRVCNDVNGNVSSPQTIQIAFNINSFFNNWKITQAGTSNSWVVSKTGNFTVDVQPGGGKLFRIEPVMIAGGNIVYNESIPSGTSINIKGDITLNSGVTLTFQQNTTLKFASGKSLTVNGTLNVQGTSSNKVTFDFISPDATAKNGIKLNGSGSLSISHAIIKNAYNGISITTPVSGSPSIENSEIKNCYNGIVIQYGNKDADITIADNNIYDNTNYGISISNPDHFGMNFEPSTSDNIITSCNYGIYLNEANVDISGSEFSDCIYGLYLYRTNYAGGQPTITDVHSHDNSTSGIALYYSSPKILDSEFDDNHYGINCSNYSSAELGYAGTYGNNNIHNNFYGLYAFSNSNPFLGRQTCIIQGGNNKIAYNGPYNARVLSSSTVIAEQNYWGANPPQSSLIYADGTSSIDYTPWLVSSPFKLVPNRSKSPEEYVFNKSFGNTANSGGYAASSVDTIKPNSFDPNWPMFWKILYARNLVDVGKYKFAQEICKDIINEYSDSSLSFYALDLLWKASQANDEESFKTYLTTIKNKRITKNLYGSAEIILSGFENTGRISSLDNLASQYSSRSVGEAALFSKFLYYINEQKNIEMAREVSKELDDKFPDSPAAIDAHLQLGDKVKDMIISKSGNVEKLLSEDNMPKEYTLLGNYPNPFNPSTKIRYALPFDSDVEITIYNINGEIVKAFKYGSQSAGIYDVKWEGTNSNSEQVSSGIYLYHFKAVSLQKNNEVFEKSAKLILMK